MKYKVAFILNCYNEEKNIEKIYEKLQKELLKSKKIKDYVIYFINDVSTDNTLENIQKLMKKDKHIILLNFKQRMGKSIGLQAAFSEVKKDIDLVFMMDADLQDDPKEINRFITKIEQGYDLVSGYKKNRLDNLEKKAASKVYNKVLNFVFGMNLHDHNCGFKCFKRKVLDDLKIYDNLHRYITILVNSMNYKVGEIDVLHHKRIYGKSKYGLSRYFIGFKDMIRIKYIITHQKKTGFIIDLLWLLIVLSLALFSKTLFIVIFFLSMLIWLVLLSNLYKYNHLDIKVDKNLYTKEMSKN